MKRILQICLLVLFFMPQVSHAQGTPQTVELLKVELWPDYDQTAVLVLINGVLPADTPLPATLTLPLPEDADFNVVARRDAVDGIMKSDIEYDIDAGAISFTTPDLQFRIEYYRPYSADDTQRSFDFTWLADVTINQFQVDVQQPRSASALLTQPAAVDVYTGDNGLSYHSLPSQAVPAGQPFSMHVDYTMDTPQLSAAPGGPQITDVQTTGFEPDADEGDGVNWGLILGIAGGVILLGVAIAVTWRVATDRATSRPQKPRPTRSGSGGTTTRYCHICGQPNQPEDKFCRECGTPAKTSGRV